MDPAASFEHLRAKLVRPPQVALGLHDRSEGISRGKGPGMMSPSSLRSVSNTCRSAHKSGPREGKAARQTQACLERAGAPAVSSSWRCFFLVPGRTRRSCRSWLPRRWIAGGVLGTLDANPELDIQPPLPRPPVAVAQHRARERARIRAPVLPRPRIDVADRPLAGGLQGRDLRGAIVEPIDVIRGRRIGVVHRPRQLPIPRQQLRRHPRLSADGRRGKHQQHTQRHAQQPQPPADRQTQYLPPDGPTPHGGFS